MYTRIYLLGYPKETSGQSIIYRLVKDYDIECNILKADIRPQHDGIMVLEVKGTREKVKAGKAYLESLGVKVASVATRVGRDEERCFHCGGCTSICASGALALSRPTMEVLFEADKCTGCGLCVPVCPVRAMKVSLNQVEEELG